jgi:HEAT repeat protein
MSHTKEELIKLIDLDEPDYSTIVPQLTSDDIPLLVVLSNDVNLAVATKAISCLGMMNNEKAVDGISLSAKHDNPIIRVAAAHALKNLATFPNAVTLLDKLLDDKDIGVRKFALKTVNHANINSLKTKVKSMNSKEKTEFMKKLSNDVFINIDK